MKSRNLKVAMVTLALISLGVVGVASGESEIFKGQDNAYANPAITYGLAAPVSFHFIYGRWPSSWQEITDAGLVQVTMLNHKGVEVDLNDGSLDFPGDIHFVPAANDDPPKLAYKGGGGGGGGVKIMTLLPMSDLTYDSLISRQGNDGPSAWLVGNHEAQKLLGMQSLLQKSIQMFVLINGRQPRTWQELRESGVAPYDDDSVNPVTGGSLLFDGSPYNMKFEFLEEHAAAVIQVVGPDGRPLWSGTIV